ncbi:MAG: hypothetical protein KJP15_09450 [Gammaproteobacteria bacterium]|nr:hypothetical protein [Gammaproteobacteria bacterium]
MSGPRPCVTILVVLLVATTADAAQCVYISSYHKGYAWSDGVERGLLKTLDGKCEITIFNMNTKYFKDEKSIKNAALEAKQLIDQTQPDVVIASDDNASKYLIVPYYKDATIPFVFCGVNWTVEQYGYPFSNVTGMIEVAAVEQMFDKAAAIIGQITRAYYIGADTLTEKKNLRRFQSAAAAKNIKIDSRLVSTMKQWIGAYEDAQQADLIIMGSYAGIGDWDEAAVLTAIKPITKTLSTTNHGWMMPFTMFGMTKIPEEQGEWAGKLAIEILRGTKPSAIPIIPNRKFNLIVNNALLEIAQIKLPLFIRLRAQLY